MIAVVGFAVRFVYLLQARQHDPLFFSPQMDAEYHLRWALAIASGTDFVHGAFFRAPLYPYFLAGLMKLGLGLFGARVVQALLGGASCGIVYLLARRILAGGGRSGLSARAQENTARISGLVMAIYSLSVYFDGEFLIPALLVFLVLLGMVLLYRSLDSDRQWWLPGLAFGLAAIARPNVLAFVAVLAVLLIARYRAGAWKRLGWFAGAVCLVILPVTVRNYAVSRTFVPIAWQAGTNFYIGNNPEADGVTAVVPGTRASWWGGYYDVKTLAEQAEGRELRGAEIDRYWLGRGIDFWRQEPVRALGLLVRKAYLLLSGYEISNNRNIYHAKRFTFLNLAIFRTSFLKFPFGLLLPLALAGVYLGRRAARRWAATYAFLLAYGFSFVIFFVTARYRMPAIPFLIVLAVYAVARLVKTRGRELWVSLAVLLVSLVAFNSGIYGPPGVEDEAQTRFSVAMGLYRQGRLDDALVEIEKALQHDSASNVLVLESAVRLGAGQPGPAVRAAQAAISRTPNAPEPYGQMGNVYASLGRYDSALVCFEKACELDPHSVSSWNNLGSVAMAQGDFESARRYFDQALAIDPASTVALYNLGLLDWQEGEKGLARTRWHKVLELDPSHAKAGQALEHFR